jgi:hypothetical protein
MGTGVASEHVGVIVSFALRLGQESYKMNPNVCNDSSGTLDSHPRHDATNLQSALQVLQVLAPYQLLAV